MKKTASIVFVYIGLVIGAGFASGREILEYFNNNNSDFSSIIFSSFLFAALSFMVMHHSIRLKVKDFDSFIDCTAGKLSAAVKLFMSVYMFCGLFVMMSGSGALFAHIFGSHSELGILLIALICFLVFSFDLSGLIALNTFMVPLMVLGMTMLCLSSLLFPVACPVFSFTGINRHSPLISSICYTSYNTITAGAVLIPLACKTDSKIALRSSLISSSILGLLIFLVWLVQNMYFNYISDSEMPLLELASFQGNIPKYIYAVVLFMSLCTTAVSHGFGILSKFQLKSFSERSIASAILCLCAIPFAKIGFSDLVANLYSAFGFLGLIWLVIVLSSYARHK